MGYVEFLSLVRGAAFVVTDSGGIQEETTVLGVPCLTVRPNTERPITITHGTNRLVGPEEVGNAVAELLAVPPSEDPAQSRRYGTVGRASGSLASSLSAWRSGNRGRRSPEDQSRSSGVPGCIDPLDAIALPGRQSHT